MNSLQDFINAFNVRFYTVTSVDGMGWANAEICDFLNNAQLQLVELIASSGELESIAHLIKTDTKNFIPSKSFTESDYDYDRVVLVEFDMVDFLHYISSTAAIEKYNIAVSTAYPLDKINAKDIPSMLSNTQNVATFRNPKVVVLGDTTGDTFKLRLNIIVDSFTTSLERVKVQYVSRPREFDIKNDAYTNLNRSLHNTIVNTAVEIAVKSMVNTQHSNQ